MAKLKDKIQTALDENRMLILGFQVLLGFEYRNFFEPRFNELEKPLQYMKLTSLLLMFFAFGFLLLPTSYHRIVERGEDTDRFNHFIGRAMRPVLPAFVFAIGMDLFVASQFVVSRPWAIVLGCALALVGLVYLGGLQVDARWHREEGTSMSEEQEQTPLKDKIRQVLTEARVVLPGAQALLGFQFATVFMEAFAKLPASSKSVHLASLVAITLATMLLMAPAAYHRIVLHGEENEDFHRYASRMVLSAIVPLGLGLIGDLFVVGRMVTSSTAVGIWLAGAGLVFLFGTWFGWPLVRRAWIEQKGRSPATQLGSHDRFRPA